MKMNDLERIIGDLPLRLNAWVEAESEDLRCLATLKEGTKNVPMSAKVRRELFKALESSAVEIRRGRQRQAAEWLAEKLREVGIILNPGVPRKRAPRKRRDPKSSPVQVDPLVSVSELKSANSNCSDDSSER